VTSFMNGPFSKFRQVFQHLLHCAHITLLTGVDLTNVLHTALTLVEPKSAKRHWWHYSLFALLGSVLIKALRKYVGEIDPRSRNDCLCQSFEQCDNDSGLNFYCN